MPKPASGPLPPPPIAPTAGPVLLVAAWILPDDEPLFQIVFDENPRVKICNARTEECDLAKVYGLLLAGGGDISPQFLKQPVPDPAVIRNPDPARDEWEIKAVNEVLKGQLPIFGIDRGCLVLNVALGGTIKLDVTGHDDAPNENKQPLKFAAKTSYNFPAVNSSHHQSVDKLGALLSIEAWGQDDIVEQIRMHPYVFGMGVQYHPERDVMYRPLFKDFFAAVIAYQVWKKR